jgi:hypothetical protein
VFWARAVIAFGQFADCRSVGSPQAWPFVPGNKPAWGAAPGGPPKPALLLPRVTLRKSSPGLAWWVAAQGSTDCSLLALLSKTREAPVPLYRISDVVAVFARYAPVAGLLSLSRNFLRVGAIPPGAAAGVTVLQGRPEEKIRAAAVFQTVHTLAACTWRQQARPQ